MCNQLQERKRLQESPYTCIIKEVKRHKEDLVVMKKYVYLFSEGNKDMRNLLGGRVPTLLK